METLSFTQKLVTQECIACGMVFGVPSGYDARRRDDHQTFYCPSGHPQCYGGKSEAERLRDELAKQKHLTEQAEARAKSEREMRWEANRATEKVERSLRATKAVVTRTKKKIVAGRCPCCSTKFKDLAVHMRTEHPNYDPEKAATAIEAKG